MGAPVSAAASMAARYAGRLTSSYFVNSQTNARLFAEHLGDLFARGIAVFDHVMQQRRA